MGKKTLSIAVSIAVPKFRVPSPRSVQYPTPPTRPTRYRSPSSKPCFTRRVSETLFEVQFPPHDVWLRCRSDIHLHSGSVS
ncbi:hypothetical protein FJTKL_10494 [Diaporthe vaccinii]|uniref:Uncharacterized protein n=1 Tax=Diaporthe vaccinii TaxID=105482 RepID=A0ABR4EJN6_9PEZI